LAPNTPNLPVNQSFSGRNRQATDNVVGGAPSKEFNISATFHQLQLYDITSDSASFQPSIGGSFSGNPPLV